MDKLKNFLSIWGEQNKADPGTILAIIHVITLWRKGQPLQPPPYLPTTVSNALKKTYQYMLAPVSNGTHILRLGRSAKCLPEILRGQNPWGQMDI